MNDEAVRTLRGDPVFQQVVRSKSRLSWGLAVLMVAIFFGYLGAVAVAPGFIGAPFSEGGVLTNGIVAGLAVVACAVASTAVYVVRANGRIDRLLAELRARVKA